MNLSFTRLGVIACTVFITQMFGASSARAVPSDVVAWSSLEDGITVYEDAVRPTEIFWFIPKIKFETKAGKTMLRASTLANGRVQYITRIIPYFDRDLRELVARNLSTVRQDSQLRPVVARDIGFALTDFGYTFTTPTVTNYQYLDVPRLIRFTLDPEEAALFDELYQDESGVNVSFNISYDGMMTEKFYKIEISCKDIKKSLEAGLGRGSSIGGSTGSKDKRGVVLGADIQAGFLSSVANSNSKVNITSMGDNAGLEALLARVMNTCFEPVDEYGSYGRYRETCEDRGDCCETEGRNCPEDRDDREGGREGDLLPKAQLKLKFKYKAISSDKESQSIVNNITMKNSISQMTLNQVLSASPKAAGKVEITSPIEKKFTVGPQSVASAPFASGIRIGDGEQYTINAEFIFKAKTTNSRGKIAKYTWNADWNKPDGELYYRIGSGSWFPVNRRTVITSDVSRGGGELQFYINRSALFNKLPEKLRKGNLLVPAFVNIAGFQPEFAIQVTGNKVRIR